MNKKLKTLLTLLLLATPLFAIAVLGNSALAYDPAVATYTWNATTPNYDPAAVIHPGTINLANLAMGDFLGIRSDWLYALGFGDMGVSVNWDDTWGPGMWVGDANTNGDQLDGLYVQIGWNTEGWWDLGFAANQIVVFTSQDHDPYLGEGLEYRVYGTNTLWDGNNLSPQATLTDVYLDGWRPHNPAEETYWVNGWCSDDITGVLRLNASYRYIRLVSWDPWGSSSGYDEPEVDAIAGVMVVSANVDIKPDTLSLGSQGQYVTIYIELPAAYDPHDIIISTIKLDGTIQALQSPFGFPDTNPPNGIPELMVKFDRAAVQSHIYNTLGISYGPVTLTITGSLTTGETFLGSDTITVHFSGDANSDGIIDILDISVVSAHWYPGPPTGVLGYNANADFNKDGAVDISDIAMLSVNWGQKTPTP